MKKITTFLTRYLKSSKPHLRAYIFLFGLYAATKSVVYFAPLFLYQSLNDVVSFGAFEYSLNLGQTFSALFCFGLHGAYTYFVFKKKKQEWAPAFHFIYLLPCLLILLTVLLVPSLLTNPYISGSITGIALANQLYSTTFYKLKNRNTIAILADCGIYFLILLFAACLYYNLFPYKFNYWTVLVLVYLLILNMRFHWSGIKNLAQVPRQGWTQILSYSAYTTIILLLTSLLTTSTRIYAEYFANYEQVGLYSFYIRISALIIIFHRVVLILFYKYIYTGSHEKIDHLFSIMIYLVFGVTALLYWLFPLLIKISSGFGTLGFILDERMLKLTLFQSAFWAGLALIEIVLYRKNLLKVYAQWLTGLLLIMILLFTGINHFYSIDIYSLTGINAAFIGIATLIQLLILKRKGIIYKNTLYAHLTGILIFTIFFAFL